MDNQSNLPNSAEAPTSTTPESLVIPAVPAAETNPVQAANVPLPKLSPADVAAAIAATPLPAAQPTVASSTSPNIAGDVDVIEPEWVEKAEAVVREHQGDPYAEEEAIQKLQEDYLQKRYGISVAEPDADNTKPEGK